MGGAATRSAATGVCPRPGAGGVLLEQGGMRGPDALTSLPAPVGVLLEQCRLTGARHPAARSGREGVLIEHGPHWRPICTAPEHPKALARGPSYMWPRTAALAARGPKSRPRPAGVLLEQCRHAPRPSAPTLLAPTGEWPYQRATPAAPHRRVGRRIRSGRRDRQRVAKYVVGQPAAQRDIGCSIRTVASMHASHGAQTCTVALSCVALALASPPSPDRGPVLLEHPRSGTPATHPSQCYFAGRPS